VSPVSLLLVLLVVAYIGGHWTSTPGKRAFGSASGIEYVVLGLVLGPQVLGSLDAQLLVSFEPVSLVALGWIALGYGAEVGAVGDHGVRAGPVLCGLLLTMLIAVLTALCVYPLTGWCPAAQRWLLSAGVGLVSAQSARDAVLWMADRHAARGPLQRWLLDFSRADDAPVLLALPFLFAAFHAPQRLAGAHPGWALMACGALSFGALLGLIAAWLTSFSASRVERWTILLGSGFLAAGSAESLGLGAMGCCFALGVVLSLRVEQTAQIREALAATEGPVLLPALVLAGAHLAPPRGSGEWLLLACAGVARVAITVLGGSVLALASRRPREVRRHFGLGLLSSGTLSVIVGFALALRFGGDAGRGALSAAFLGTLLGELVGTPALRRALAASGEIAPAKPADARAAGQPEAEVSP
jgi:Kef-type K+ transport system membrane component KefB